MSIKTEEVVQGRAFYLSAQLRMRFVMDECIFSLVGTQRVVLRLALPFPSTAAGEYFRSYTYPCLPPVE